MTTPIGCALLVDGVRVADGTPGDPDQAPTALTGLSVTWGRETTVDQVEPSTCSFSLMDPPGGGSFLDLLYVGAQVDVTAAGTVAAPPTLPINADPGFELGAPGTAPAALTVRNAGSTLTYTTAQAATGSQSILWRQGPNPLGNDVVNAYPAPLSADPAAWDDLPTVQAGETWEAAVTVLAAPGAQILAQIGLYSRPDGTRPGPWAGSIAANGTGDWQTLSPAFIATPAQAGMWVGLSLTVVWPIWANARGAWTDQAGTWDEQDDAYLDDFQVLAPATAGQVRRDVVVFSGRVTDLDAGWDNGPGTVVCQVTAADFTADLGQRDVGDVPWPAERLDARFAHIITAAAVSIPYTIAPTLAAWQVSWLDVDRQQAWPLLADLATSVDGVLWSATHRDTGPYLWLADPRVQSALYVLYPGEDGLVHVGPTSAAGRAVELDACDVLLEPVVFKQAVSDVTTRVSVTWLEQTLDDDGQPSPTEHTDVFIDADLEARLGTRGASVSTLLTTAADADAVAVQLLARLHLGGWRVGGLTWLTDPAEMDSARAARALDLLDGTRRLGAAVLLTNLPDWAPSAGATLPLLLQGGTYTFDDGYWALDLTTSSAAAQGTSLPWNLLDPGWSWTEFSPDVAWADLVGVAA